MVAVADEAGVPKGTVHAWSGEDGGWKECRKNYEIDLQKASSRKAIAKFAEKRSDDLAGLIEQQYATNRTVLSICSLFFEAFASYAKEASSGDPEKIIEILTKTYKPSDLNFFSLMVERHLRVEREVTGLNYAVNPNLLAELLRKMGVESPEEIQELFGVRENEEEE